MANIIKAPSITKDPSALEVEKSSSLDATHVPNDNDVALTEEEKRVVKRAT